MIAGCTRARPTARTPAAALSMSGKKPATVQIFTGW